MADHASTFLFVTVLALIVILLIFGMKYLSAARTARLRISGEGAYRELADRTARAQEENAAALASIQSRLAHIETVLKEVG